MNLLNLNLNKLIHLLISAGALTILYELISSLFSFNYSRKKIHADYLIENLYCMFQNSLETQLFKHIQTIVDLRNLLNELHSFQTYIESNPKILFYLNDHLKISLDETIIFGERFLISDDINDLAKFRFSFNIFSKKYLNQINKDRKTIGLPKHGCKYRLFYKIYPYKHLGPLFLLLDYFASFLLTFCIITIVSSFLFYFILTLFY